MASRDAKVRVRLDTKQAQSELRRLGKQAKATAGRVGRGIRGAVGRGLGLVGLGAGVGAGMAAVRGATESGLGDVVGEALGGYGQQLSDYFLGSIDEDARASKSAREDTIQTFGMVAGMTGKIPPGAVNYFNQIKAMRMSEEKGREMFEADDRFRGPGVEKAVDQILGGVQNVVKDGLGWLADQLLAPFG